MRHSLWLAAVLLALLLSDLPLAKAQDSPPSTAGQKKNDSESPLRRGSNEFGVWTGYSPFSFKFKGQTEDRKLFLLNLQYARTLFATRPLTFKYTAEIVPWRWRCSRHKRTWLTGLCWSTRPVLYTARAQAP